MNSKCELRNLLATPAEYNGKTIEISGWVRTLRASKNFGFIEINDGTTFKNLQIVFADQLENFADISKITLGSAITVIGELVETPGAKQPFEINASSVQVNGLASLDYPIQKKRHTLEYLRTISHLRPRTNTFLAVFRVRNLVSYAIHRFFQEKGFINVHTPIVTSVDAEGAGEMFRVSTLDPENLPRTPDQKINYSEELLGKPSFLTVSGQLAVETFCLGFRNVYTFGPTFRAENSNTARHATEFWMVEPEVAFAKLEDIMNLAEEMLKFLINYLLEHAPDEMNFFNSFVEPELLSRLNNILNSEFARITYTEAISILKDSGHSFEYPVEWGENLQTEHERYLAEEKFKKPVFVTDYPKEIKAFYMRMNEDGKTVRATDLLVPGVGEIIGGSQREERLNILSERMAAHNISEEEYYWYLDTRRFGTFEHAGFGLGLERAVMYLTGMKNIRDVIPFPRTPKSMMA